MVRQGASPETLAEERGLTPDQVSAAILFARARAARPGRRAALYRLLDECCPKSLVGIAGGLGHTAQRTLAIAELGRQATDAAIFAFAGEARAIVVTVNAGDFLVLAV